MKEYRVDAAITIAENTKLGLAKSQFEPRAHCLRMLEVAGLQLGLIGCITVRPVQFKTGEVIWADELPKNLASQLTVEPAASGEASSGADEDASTDEDGDKAADFSSWTAAQIRQWLKDNGVAFAANASKSALVEIASAAAASDSDDEASTETEDDL